MTNKNINNMKSSRLFIATWALLFILMVSCNREQERIENPVSITIGEVTFNASFGDSQKTKTVIKNDTEIWWSPNDAINVFYGDLTGGKFTATVSREASSSQFVGSFSAVTGTLETESDNRPFWAVYPYDVLNSCDGNSVNLTVPIKQMGEEGTFAPKIFPAIATSTGLDLAFYNVCGGIVLTITRDDIRAITLTGNNDEIIAGTIRVAFEDGLPAIKEIVAGEKSITFRSPNNKPFIPGTKYFITAIPGIFSQGFKLQFVAANGEEGVKEIAESKTINRSRFLVVNDADANVSFAPNANNANLIHFVDLDLKDKLVAAFDKDGDGELSYDEAAAVESPNDIIAAFGDYKDFRYFDEFQYFTGITEIPSSMFRYWSRLASIVLPETITVIKDYAFGDCSQLKSIVFPESVESLGTGVCWGCTSLTTVTLSSGITTIPSSAFRGCAALLSVYIPSGVTAIKGSAFWECKALASINIPESITVVDSWAFYGCDAMSNVFFDTIDSIFNILSKHNNNDTLPWQVTKQPVHLFVAGQEITSISIPDSFITIPNFSFLHCVSLESVTIPEGCLSIGGSAFKGCTSLLSVTIPEGCQSIGGSAFEGCTSLLSVTIPEGCQSIGDAAFRGCSKLITFEFPSSIISIASAVLQSCTSLISITVKAVEVPTGGAYMFSTYGGDCPIYVPEESIDAYKSAPYWSDYASRIMPIMAEGDDASVSDNVTARFLGGAMSIVNGVIQSNSKLNYGVYNNSDKSIDVLTIQLLDGETGAVGNMMSVNRTIDAGANQAWTITIGAAGIHSPTAIFVYRCEGKRYEIRVPYPN